MSHEVLKEVLGRAMLEAEFRELLLSDPERALQGQDLTQEEIALLKSLPRETLEGVATDLEERVSRAGFTFSKHIGVSDSDPQPFPRHTDPQPFPRHTDPQPFPGSGTADSEPQPFPGHPDGVD